MAKKEGIFTPKPYARLLTMLSEQLIKNNTVALTEIAKNSYDADADWVQIRIGNTWNFGKEGLKDEEKPFVEIEDNGEGMSLNTIEKCWMNPASSNKFLKRLSGESRTKKGRIIQGEKGIGRYAVFKIGKKVEIFTRQKMMANNVGGDEVYLLTDLSRYTEELIFQRPEIKKEKEKFGDFLFKKEMMESEPLYFDEIKSEYKIFDNQNEMKIKPGEIIIESKPEKRYNYGTLIRITDLNEEWSKSDVQKIRRILADLQSPFRKEKEDFAVSMLWDDEEISAFEKFSIEEILDEADMAIEGDVDNDGLCSYTLSSGIKKDKGEIDLVDNLKKEFYRENREHFFEDKDGGYERIHSPICGPFTFKYFVYDLSLDAKLDNELRSFVKKHRIYIYRDDIRIYPYGDKDNDWIKLDILRGLVRAGFYLSNDQTIGYVNISWESNKLLKDKTNREGLIEQGTAYEDLRLLNLSILNFLYTEFKKLKSTTQPKDMEERQSQFLIQAQKVETQIEKVKKRFIGKDDSKGKEIVETLDKEYRKERNILDKEIETVEDLAGVGIAVDAASHDIIVMMDRLGEKIQEIREIAYSNSKDIKILRSKIDLFIDQFRFVDGLLRGIQPIFRSARRKNKELRISEIIKKVEMYFKAPLGRLNIESIDIEEINPPLIVQSSEGVLLQLFINLLENAVYWLKVAGPGKPQVKVFIDGKKGYAIFADNGNGVKKEDVDYIFEPFFSTKGMGGRGLGLYIARQLTDRHDYGLYYIENEKDKILPGANFRIDFIKQEQEN